MFSIKSGDDASLATSLLEETPEVPKQVSLGGWTPLHLACRLGRTATVKVLLDYGAQPRARFNCLGPTPGEMGKNFAPDSSVVHFIARFNDIEHMVGCFSKTMISGVTLTRRLDGSVVRSNHVRQEVSKRRRRPRFRACKPRTEVNTWQLREDSPLINPWVLFCSIRRCSTLRTLNRNAAAHLHVPRTAFSPRQAARLMLHLAKVCEDFARPICFSKSWI